jgi:hypothetical protein
MIIGVHDLRSQGWHSWQMVETERYGIVGALQVAGRLRYRSCEPYRSSQQRVVTRGKILASPILSPSWYEI